MKLLKHLGALSLLTLFITPVVAQTSYKGLPVVLANSTLVNLRVGNVLVNGLWTIKPESSLNSLHIQVAGQKERLVFYTDIDSAVYEVRPARADQFYVLLNKKQYVLTEVKGFKKPEAYSVRKQDKFLNIDKPRSKTFGTLWEKHNIGEAVEGINNYADKASSAVNWVKSKLQ